jgi:hypothetical protein
MIVSHLRGGLGNQLFQYAMGRALALRRKTELILDAEWFDGTHPGMESRTFELGRYGIKVRQLLSSERKWIQRCTAGDLKRFSFVHRWTYFKEADFNQYYPSAVDLRGNVYLEGYWQYPDYFADCENLIRAELMPRREVCEVDPAIVKRIKDVNSISIHVRRGDYLTSARFIGALPMAYYTSAIAWMAERIENPYFFVFSDDPDWVRANILIDGHVEYMAHDGVDSMFRDLHLMAECRHHIIANSSFSWWAAWLSSDKSPLVVAPKRWFAELPPGNHPRLPANWIAL